MNSGERGRRMGGFALIGTENDMSLYPSLPLILVAAGVALLVAIAYLARLVRRHRRSLARLLKLAKANLDPLHIPASAWPALTDGGMQRLDFSGHWFGQTVKNTFGAAQPAPFSRPFTFQIIADDDIQLDFRLYAKTERGEARLFTENLAGVFRLLLETAVHSKMEALSAAMAEQARLTLYLQHDLRNLAQWVDWLATDLSTAENNDALLCIAQRLKNSAPHAARRAQHILNATCKSHPTLPPTRETITLSDAIHQSADHAGLNVAVNGDAVVLLRRDLFERTLENLFTNIAPLIRSHPSLSIAVEISHKAGRILAKIDMPRLAEVSQFPPEKLFEPFASGRPGGLGMGLYQAHKSLREAGGELTAEIHGDTVCFLLDLPGNQD